MELMLTGDEITGVEAAAIGCANRAFPADRARGAGARRRRAHRRRASDLTQINKRLVHRQADVMGARAAIRAGNELQALAGHQASVEEFRKDPLASVKRANAGDEASEHAAAAAGRRRVSDDTPLSERSESERAHASEACHGTRRDG